ncbi:MAG: Ig-like domain-containing protein [Bacteroidales bacterium]
MKPKVFLLILLLSVAFSNAQNNPPVAVNDTIDGVPEWDMIINLTQNDYDPDGDPVFIGYVGMGDNGCYIISDSTVYITLSMEPKKDFFNGFTKLVYYVSDDTTSWGYSFDTGYVIIRYNDLMFYDSLNINNVNAMFNCFGHHFWDLPGGVGSKFFVPDGSSQTSIFNNTLWIGGLDEDEELHLAAERYRQVGEDYYHGPFSNSYDSIYDAKWFRIWKLNKEEIEYHKAHWWQEDYVPIKDIAEWPGNGNPELGQSENLAPYFDYNNDGTYDPIAGDWPVIKGDQALFFVFNDDRKEHTETEGKALGIEIRAMAYAFNEPTDSALWHTVFLNYEIENKSDTTYGETYVGTFSDIDLGNSWMIILVVMFEMDIILYIMVIILMIIILRPIQ